MTSTPAEIIARMRERGLNGHEPDPPLYVCRECGAESRWVGKPPPAEVLSFCPECGEIGDDMMQRVLVQGDPIILSERG